MFHQNQNKKRKVVGIYIYKNEENDTLGILISLNNDIIMFLHSNDKIGVSVNKS